jgi:hypothetical protein
MFAYLLAADRAETVVQAVPRCGKDFCDQCGDCLCCYGDDPCGMHEGDHTWVVYSDRLAEFYADHPEIVRADRIAGPEA